MTHKHESNSNSFPTNGVQQLHEHQKTNAKADTRCATNRAVYDGAELRNNPGVRPGRMRAYSMPSLIGGERVPYSTPKAQASSVPSFAVHR